MLISHLYVFFEEMSMSILSPLLIGLFVISLLNCQSSLYFLRSSLWSDTWFADFASHSLTYLFMVSMISLGAQLLLLVLVVSHVRVAL